MAAVEVGDEVQRGIRLRVSTVASAFSLSDVVDTRKNKQ